jgi:hypothetical protein
MSKVADFKSYYDRRESEQRVSYQIEYEEPQDGIVSVLYDGEEYSIPEDKLPLVIVIDGTQADTTVMYCSPPVDENNIISEDLSAADFYIADSANVPEID